MPDQPRGRVSRNVELRHDTYAALSGVRDNFARLVLRIEKTVRAHLMKLRKLLALDAKALIFSQVPVQDIELDGGHRVQVALQDLHRLKVSPDINQKPTPA